MALELKLTVLYLSSVVVCRSRVDMGWSEHQSYLHHLLLCWLIHPPDVHCQLSKSMHMGVIHELNLWTVSLIEDDSHYSLAGANRAVDLSMDLVNTYWLSFTNKSIKDILTEVFSINHYSLTLGMEFWVKDSESIDSIGFFGYSWGNWSRI